MDYNAQDKQIHIVNLAVCASLQAFEEYSSRSLNCRRDIITAIRVKLRPYLQEIAEREYAETCMGNVRDKIIKLVLALDKTPGVEDLISEVVTGDHGMTLHEQAYQQVDCIYAETKEDENGYAERYWVSVDTGLLTAAQRLQNGEEVYRMEGVAVSMGEPEAALFTLPDGTAPV